MKPSLFYATVLVLFCSSQIFARDWVDMPRVKDMSHLTEKQKAYEWLDERGEVDFEIYPDDPFDIKPLVNVISIVHVEPGKVVANADRAGFEKFLEYGFDYEVKVPAFLSGPVPMSDYAEYLSGEKKRESWTRYPTYQALVGFQEKFERDYPEICKMYDLGPSGVASKNHRIYALRISDNVEVNEAEPRYLETNVIHGDEVLNMMNCLHMVDTILSSYGKQERFTKLVDSLEMWFIPNMNPDATYRSGDNTVQGAQRRNLADNFDLNRNNPCPCEQGDHKYYGLYHYYAKETEALMGLHAKYKFQFAQDQHGGTETYLWPYGGVITRPKDEDWYKWFAKKLVGQIHKDCNNNGYMTSCGGDGVGHIYTELYECHGIRCDMNDWVGNGKSLTLESSVTKLLSESDLARHWRYCKEALLMSYEILYKGGLHGTVVDSQTNEPIFGVEISRNGDIPNGTVLTDSAGRYVKYMNKGTYTITFKHDDYVTKEVSNFTMSSYEERYNMDVKLWPLDPTNTMNKDVSVTKAFTVIPYKHGVRINLKKINRDAAVGIYGLTGKLIKTIPVQERSGAIWDGLDSKGRSVGNGCYIVKVLTDKRKYTASFIFNR